MSDSLRHVPSQRVFLDEPVWLTPAGEELAQPGRALNLSTGGLFVCTEAVLDAGSAVLVRFSLPGGTLVSAEAAVVRAG